MARRDPELSKTSRQPFEGPVGLLRNIEKAVAIGRCAGLLVGLAASTGCLLNQGPLSLFAWSEPEFFVIITQSHDVSEKENVPTGDYLYDIEFGLTAPAFRSDEPCPTLPPDAAPSINGLTVDLMPGGQRIGGMLVPVGTPFCLPVGGHLQFLSSVHDSAIADADTLEFVLGDFTARYSVEIKNPLHARELSAREAPVGGEELVLEWTPREAGEPEFTNAFGKVAETVHYCDSSGDCDPVPARFVADDDETLLLVELPSVLINSFDISVQSSEVSAERDAVGRISGWSSSETGGQVQVDLTTDDCEADACRVLFRPTLLPVEFGG